MSTKKHTEQYIIAGHSFPVCNAISVHGRSIPVLDIPERKDEKRSSPAGHGEPAHDREVPQ